MIVLLLTLSIWGCKRKTADTNAKTESRLKAAMQDELYKAVNYDSATIKYRVLDVTFYEEKNRFICEFKVRLMQNGHDTTGIMTADISRDMTVVKRKS
jgi:light-regulated signal transduction histidine kinase (bacteriophytochrome)